MQSITVAMDKSRVNANATRLKPRSMPPSTSECRIPILSMTGPVSRENLMGRRGRGLRKKKEIRLLSTLSLLPSELACKYVVRPHNTPLLCRPMVFF